MLVVIIVLVLSLPQTQSEVAVLAPAVLGHVIGVGAGVGNGVGAGVGGVGAGVGTYACGVRHFTEVKPALSCAYVKSEVSASTVPDSALLQVPIMTLPFQ